MSDKRMKLYVWANPYGVAYGSSMVFAIAESLPAARKQCVNGTAWSYVDCGTEGAEWMGKIKLGKPTRIVDLPCAEWHEWSE